MRSVCPLCLATDILHFRQLTWSTLNLQSTLVCPRAMTHPFFLHRVFSRRGISRVLYERARELSGILLRRARQRIVGRLWEFGMARRLFPALLLIELNCGLSFLSIFALNP